MSTYIVVFSIILTVLFVICCAYRFVFLIIRLTGAKKKRAEGKRHRYAVLIAARNEEAVIGHLLDSLQKQDYPSELVDIYVVADNCTDSTASTARAHGAKTYERHHAEQIGKGYAIRFLLEQIRQETPLDEYDGFFLFDADNLLHSHYISAMNDVFDEGHTAVLGYRAAKNFADNWVSASCGIYFIYESECANRPRDVLGTSCILSGTGCLFSEKMLEKYGGWIWTSCAEDLECSAELIADGEYVAYCPDAVLYDEQPQNMRESIVQRTRWLRGYFEAAKNHGGRLAKRLFHRGRFAAYDYLMLITPIIIFFLSTLISITELVILSIYGESVNEVLVEMGIIVAFCYVSMYIPSISSVLLAWKNIHASPAKKIVYTFGFPVFMSTFLVVFFRALFTEQSWQPISHKVAVPIEDIEDL